MSRPDEGMIRGLKRAVLPFLILGTVLPALGIPAAFPGEESGGWRTVEHRAFQTGEHLAYEVVIGILNAGTATLGLPDSQTVGGRPCYRALTTLSSNTLFDPIYSVRDSLESMIDMEGLFPWQSREVVREGKYSRDSRIRFDPGNRSVITADGAKEAPPYVQDLLSIFYYVRSVPMRVGMSHPVSVFANDTLLSFFLRVVAEERVTVPAGTFECYVLEPGLRWELPDGSQGKITVWFTADDERIPVLIKTNLLFGALEAQIRLTERGSRQ